MNANLLLKTDLPRWPLLATLMAASVISCSQPSAVWVIPGSTAQHLEFGLATKRGGHKGFQLALFQVDSCTKLGMGPEGALWRLELQGADGAFPTRIQYGVVPAPYHEVGPAQPLTPGCYRVSANGAQTAFDVSPDGTLTERDSVPVVY